MTEFPNSYDAVRKRPGMYVGDVADGSGLHQLLYEAANHALCEGWAGYCNRIEIHLNADGSATLCDNGRGMPTGYLNGDSILEIVMTQLHAGGKFDTELADAPKELFGVGAAVVNILSERLDLRVWRDGDEHQIRFRRGRREGPVAIIGASDRHGVELTFLPDAEVFGGQRFDLDRVAAHFRSLMPLGLGVTLILSDDRSSQTRTKTLRI